MRFLILPFVFINSCALWNAIRPRVYPPRVIDGSTLPEEMRKKIKENQRFVIFELYSPSAKYVTLAGDFNGWGGTANGVYNPEIDRMNDDGINGDRVKGDGIWTIVKILSPGVYQYKYVIDGVHWILDPSNPEKIQNGPYLNSLLRVK
ncbi:MAG: choice-of-anchor X domain-containing protein [Candidatus Hydrothermales bacterium]